MLTLLYSHFGAGTVLSVVFLVTEHGQIALGFLGVGLLFEFFLLLSFLLALYERLLEEMKILVVNAVALWKHELRLCVLFLGLGEIFLQRVVVLFVVGDEFLVAHGQGVRKFDGDFLLFQENEFVVLHVVLGVGLQVRAQFVQIEAVFVAAALAIQEKLAELGGAETGPNHTVVQHVLVHGENGDRRLPWRVERQVGAVAGPASGRIVHVIRVDDDFLQISVLAEVLHRFQFSLVGDLRRQPNHVHESFLNYAQVLQLLDLVLGKRGNGDLGALALDVGKAQGLEGLHAATG